MYECMIFCTCVHDDMDKLLENPQELLMILKVIYTYVDMYKCIDRKLIYSEYINIYVIVYYE
jgi:hypothetical protein